MTSHSATLTTRVVPPFIPGSAMRMLERSYLVYRRIWLLIFSGFFEPVFYLFSIGIGIGKLVGDVTVNGQAVEYAAFVAPALLGASAMNGAIYESTFNIFFKLRYGKVYDAILATPMEPRHIAIGEIAWSLGRGMLYAIAFLLVITGFGYVHSAWAVMAIPAAVLIGFAFAAVGMTATTFMKSWQDFDLINMVTLPLFLFSGTFYPLDVYPPAFQILTRFSPLYHGVELIRALTLGTFDISIVGHIAFLATMGAIGVMIVSKRLNKLLLA
jgi:lipooligosaccharide transport system permease protein